uniref:Uncharacterized protein n=1 Tax=Cacopsylla melanoneura TaxID=428564 RepID=A0A8D8UFF1_9HEMI
MRTALVSAPPGVPTDDPNNEVVPILEASKLRHDKVIIDHSKTKPSKLRHDIVRIDHSKTKASKLRHDIVRIDHSKTKASKLGHDIVRIDHSIPTTECIYNDG